ncbi:FAD-dependent oxidoreductase [Streptomyces sp. NBC_00439]|uniref:FAD-dependent oxidoreductase n=1 Tax=Streptomyces sp. NBC_00439 TaxID=2903650 RepID=UPI002B1D1F29|nr:FAD-dependent oxidoreductase [Streptomyces sp. NBC_00439]
MVARRRLLRATLDLGAKERERLAARGIVVVTDGDRLRGVELAEGHVVPCSAVFVFPHMAPHDTLLTGLGRERGPNGWVTTDDAGRTSVFGVWAVGNVSHATALVITAAGQGAAAAFALNHDLVAEDVERAVKDADSSSREPRQVPGPAPRGATSD